MVEHIFGYKVFIDLYGQSLQLVFVFINIDVNTLERRGGGGGGG